MGQPRNNAIVPIYPNADHSGLEGYAVKIVAGKAALCNSLNDAPIGVIVEGGNGTTADSVALIGSGLGGTVLVRLAPSPGTVGLGTYLEITDDGDFKSDVGTAGTVCALALEAGSGRELIEAILLTNAGTVTLEQSYHTDIELLGKLLLLGNRFLSLRFPSRRRPGVGGGSGGGRGRSGPSRLRMARLGRVGQ